MPKKFNTGMSDDIFKHFMFSRVVLAVKIHMNNNLFRRYGDYIVHPSVHTTGTYPGADTGF